jgi:hypothetical protein
MVNVMAAYQPVSKRVVHIRGRREEFHSSTVYRTPADRLVCRHNIDDVIYEEHNRIIIVVLAKHGIAP